MEPSRLKDEDGSQSKQMLVLKRHRRKDEDASQSKQRLAPKLGFAPKRGLIKVLIIESIVNSVMAASGFRMVSYFATSPPSRSPPPDSPPYSFLDLGSSVDDSAVSLGRRRILAQSRWGILIYVIKFITNLRSRRPSLRPPPRPMPSLPDWEFISIVARDESCGTVYEAVHRPTDQTYALMEIPYDSSQFQEITRDVDILKGLGHPNLVKCYDVVFLTDVGLIFLILEPLECSLLGVSITSKSDFVSLAHQLLLGLNYVHQKKLSHGDVKPYNIFFNHSGKIKLLYLGKTLSRAGIGAIHDEFSWDVWSMGLCILKLSRGLNWSHTDGDLDSVPALNSDDDIGSEVEAAPSSSSPSGALEWNRDLLRLLISCMQTEVLKRWTAEQLVNHPFFDHLPSTRETDYVEDEDREYDYVESSKDYVDLERCIEHCRLFIPDCEFDKAKLVRMWIAEECIESEATRRMEDDGNLYFDALVHEEVIVPWRFDKLHRQMKYRFDASQVLDTRPNPEGGGNYVRINSSNLDKIFYRDALHLTWQCTRLDRTLVDALKNLKQLHTLVVHEDCSAPISQLPNDFFLGLEHLRTLDLSCTHLAELPGSIGRLKSLRYLDISETPIKQLPESLGRLFFLQTLNLKACFGLSVLPRGLVKLVNLRHLDLDILSQLKSMPMGMGNLTRLQTLQAFIVGKNDGCKIRELKNMNEITGSLCISRLENVSNVDDAKEAALADKKYIDRLELRWQSCGNDNFQDASAILECLQPHFHLKELQLTCYGGSRLPNWISNPSYTDLGSITLYKCINCDIIPSIGELPSLKILHILNMENVRNINTMFCRNHENEMLHAFPKLEKLTLDSMLAFEEWTGVEDGDFPSLGHLCIRYCPKLCALPPLSHLHSLQNLEISHCMQLTSLPEGLLPNSLESLIIRGCPELNKSCCRDEGLDWSKIALVRNIWIDLEKISLD